MPAILSVSETIFDPREFVGIVGNLQAITSSLSTIDHDPHSVAENLACIYASATLSFLAKEGYAAEIAEQAGVARTISAINRYNKHEGPVAGLVTLLTDLVGFGVTLDHIQQILSVFEYHGDCTAMHMLVTELYTKLVDYAIINKNQTVYKEFDGRIVFTQVP